MITDAEPKKTDHQWIDRVVWNYCNWRNYGYYSCDSCLETGIFHSFCVFPSYCRNTLFPCYLPPRTCRIRAIMKYNIRKKFKKLISGNLELNNMGVLNFLRNLNQKPSTEIRACPICLGFNLNRFHESTSGWLVPQRYVCKYCGYFGAGYISFDSNEIQRLVDLKQQR